MTTKTRNYLVYCYSVVPRGPSWSLDVQAKTPQQARQAALQRPELRQVFGITDADAATREGKDFKVCIFTRSKGSSACSGVIAKARSGAKDTL